MTEETTAVKEQETNTDIPASPKATQDGATKAAPRVSTGSLEKGRYIETVGRRKTAIARVRISEAGRSNVVINDKSVSDYFPTSALQKVVADSQHTANITQKFSITVKVRGGGMNAQAEAVRLGIARALVEYDRELRSDLKHAGFLKRDPRSKERNKFGLKKARKSAQWSKR